MFAAELVESGRCRDPGWVFDFDWSSGSMSLSVETHRSEGGNSFAPEAAVVAAGMPMDLAAPEKRMV